jgi:hypothetical protein
MSRFTSPPDRLLLPPERRSESRVRGPTGRASTPTSQGPVVVSDGSNPPPSPSELSPACPDQCRSGGVRRNVVARVSYPRLKSWGFSREGFRPTLPPPSKARLPLPVHASGGGFQAHLRPSAWIVPPIYLSVVARNYGVARLRGRPTLGPYWPALVASQHSHGRCSPYTYIHRNPAKQPCIGCRVLCRLPPTTKVVGFRLELCLNVCHPP